MTATATKVRPLADRLVVRVEGGDGMSPGGLHIPDGAGDKPQVGVVVAAGPGRWEDGGLVPMHAHEGQRVIFAKYAGHEVTIDGEELLILRETDVLAVVDG